MHIDLYRGDVTRAWARLGAVWPEYTRSLLFRVQLIRIQLLEMRARTAVAAAERSQQPEPLLVMAERDAQSLEREGQAWAIAHAHYVRAAIAACREDAVGAVEGLSRAADLYERADMPLSAQVMRYRLGEIDSSEEATPSVIGPRSGSRSRGSPPPPDGRGCAPRGSPGSAMSRPRRASESSGVIRHRVPSTRIPDSEFRIPD